MVRVRRVRHRRVEEADGQDRGTVSAGGGGEAYDQERHERQQPGEASREGHGVLEGKRYAAEEAGTKRA
jgi:hypothetical protein